MKLLLLFLTIIFLSIFTIAAEPKTGGHDGNICNGGGGASEEFIKLGQTTNEIIGSGKIKIDIPGFTKEKYADAITNTKVIAQDEPLILDGEEKDALNFPNDKKILFNTKKFNDRAPIEKSKLVIHEYLWIAGINDESYKYSQIIINEILDLVSYELFKSFLIADLQNFYRDNLLLANPNFKTSLEVLVNARNSSDLKKCSIQATSLEDYVNNQMPFCNNITEAMKESIIDLAIASPDSEKFKVIIENKNSLILKYSNNELLNQKQKEIAQNYINESTNIIAKISQKLISDITELNNSYRTKCPGRIATAAKCALNLAILFTANEEPLALENYKSTLNNEMNSIYDEISSLTR